MLSEYCRESERDMSDGEGEEQPVCVCTLHTEAKKSNCLLNTSEVKGWLGMRGVVAQPAVISLQKDKWVSHYIAVSMSDLDHWRPYKILSWHNGDTDYTIGCSWNENGNTWEKRSATHGFDDCIWCSEHWFCIWRYLTHTDKQLFIQAALSGKAVKIGLVLS